ncbi:MAG TPA: hypothetical protein VOA88_03795 [Candidatus Dormibacteraeota bacterium]|nr:hypothetical protein [Candidatus Dormibacteraeota bacterium]
MNTRTSNRNSAALYLTLLLGGTCLLVCPPKGQTQSLPVVLRITSPADGTVVHPGQAVTVIVTPTQGGSFSKVFLVAEHPIGIGANQVLTDPPYQFSITIPNNIGSARKYFVGATSIASSGQSGKALRIHLDVEPSVAISSIAVHPSTIRFIRPGDAIPLSVAGTFTDGSIMDITQSSGTTYTSGDTTAVTVGTTGVVTAIGLGNLGITPVIAQYGNQIFSVQVSTKRLPPPSH